MAEATRRDPGLLAVATSPILLAGVYAWGIAVAPALSFAAAQIVRGGVTPRPGAAFVAAALAPAALVAGVVLDRRRSQAAPLAGVWGFLGLSLAAWVLVPTSVEAGRVEALRGLLATAGFVLYGLAWGVPDVFQRANPDDDPRADVSVALPPRDRMSPAALPVAAIGIVTSALLFVFSWRLQDGPRALLGHAAAALASVLVVSAAADVALHRRRWSPPRPAMRLRRASATIAVLVLVMTLALGQALLVR